MQAAKTGPRYLIMIERHQREKLESKRRELLAYWTMKVCRG